MIAQLRIEQWFDTDSVAEKKHLFLLPVINRVGEHSCQEADRTGTVCRKQFKNNFGIRCRTKSVASVSFGKFFPEFFSKLLVIVHFAVEDNCIASAG
ncbi:hypothetical protein SDC9_109938 [bioreactor metagenome]|uniref:Uncharacterized protein n=1 Tax=bioreactor metagenome TaxID=1076179 RepID=A0A645BC71_9ZZZZ